MQRTHAEKKENKTNDKNNTLCVLFLKKEKEKERRRKKRIKKKRITFVMKVTSSLAPSHLPRDSHSS